ncbi:7,8-didemethyl-8-hydroxy-5-deazariboflavin synthase subunit CofH [Oxynema sp. CENA135]|uniref:7,8-didemethyl-8-hydroxy-5-deazariboflavin synthase subunit CofH n=1 Tax=Oxynema sp. CENA135 TaxID=984206 RepID=UPI001F29FC0E|nr:7,8-didemethyl-8-hydroxy-5-deazariboflavin synthase subunit CofH [Oxynema sp. CENA135]
MSFSMPPFAMTRPLETILDRAANGEPISPEDGVILLQQTEPEAIAQIRHSADRLRQRQAGETVTYVINRNINFTNICEQHCNFCAFRRDADSEGAFWLDFEQILEKATDATRRGATEICMQGGLNPQAKIDGKSLPYYVELVRTIKTELPTLHLHAFSPQEIEFIAREDDISYDCAIAVLREAGVDSMPGTAAEVLDDLVRRVICPEKLDSQTWLEIVETAHRLGMPTTSTMLCGHIETASQQIAHLDRLRSLQQRAIARLSAARISEFILLPFVGAQAPSSLRRRVGREQPSLSATLLLTAVSRLFLGEAIANHQPSWVKLGLDGATEALQWGCNDLGGTLMEEHITTMAGARGGTCMEPERLQGAIASIGRPFAQRDTLYRRLSEPVLC